jgi:hypothetical protein
MPLFLFVVVGLSFETETVSVFLFTIDGRWRSFLLLALRWLWVRFGDDPNAEKAIVATTIAYLY